MTYIISNDIKYHSISLQVVSRESSTLEFKEKFDFAQFGKYAKTLAGFANNSGGRIIFGVKSKPHTIIGCEETAIPDEANITTWLQNHFDPFMDFHISIFEIEGKSLICVAVASANNKPVIAKKTHSIMDKCVIEEGAIYYRYSGKSQKIKFSELQEILQAREQRIFRSLIDGLTAINSIGSQNASIVDARGLIENSGTTKIFVTKENLQKLNLIRKGYFVKSRSEGSSAYFVEGAVNVQLGTPVIFDDEDRYTSKEVVKDLVQVAQTSIHSDVKLTAWHLAKFAIANGFRNDSFIVSGQNYSNDYCKYDFKAKIWFYRKKFIEFAREKMSAEPLQAAIDFQITKKIRDQLPVSVQITS